MNLSRWLTGVFLLVPPASAGAAPPEGKTELTLLFGVSLLDVKSEAEVPIPFGLPGPRGLEPPIPIPIPIPVEFRERHSLGGSFLQGFRVGRYLTDRAELELAFTIAPSHDLRAESFFRCPPGDVCALLGVRDGVRIPDFRAEATVPAYHYDLNFVFDLARGDVRPFLSFGAGAISYDAPEQVRTDAAFNVAGGVKMYFGNVGARLEVGDHITPDHFLTGRAEHDVQVRAGFLFRVR